MGGGARAPGLAAGAGRGEGGAGRHAVPARGTDLDRVDASCSSAWSCPTRPATRIRASWAGCTAAARPPACWPRCWPAALNANLGGRDHAPIEVERQVVGWAARAVRLPGRGQRPLRHRHLDGQPHRACWSPAPGACGGDVARATACGARRAARRLRLARGARLRRQGVRAWPGLGARRAALIAVDADCRMDLDALAAAIAADRAAGLRAVPASSARPARSTSARSTTSRRSPTSAASEGCGFHVDGAFGALAVLAPELAPRLAGHRARRLPRLRLPQVGARPLRRRLRAGARRAPRTAPPSRCADGLPAPRPSAAWPAASRGSASYGPDLSRGFRALKVWFTLMTTASTSSAPRSPPTAPTPATWASGSRPQPELELLAPVALNIVCFRYRAPA